MGYLNRSMLVVTAVSLLFLGSACCAPKSQVVRSPEVKKMNISGEIAKADQGYIIRGKVPSAIFTILNPTPKLDEFNQEGRIVNVEVRVVSGDNVEIQRIEGKEYP